MVRREKERRGHETVKMSDVKKKRDTEWEEDARHMKKMR